MRDSSFEPPDPSGHDGGAAGLGLDRDETERLVVAGDGDQVGRPEPLGENLSGGRRLEAHDVGHAGHAVQAQPGGELLQLLRVLQPGAARAAEDDDHEPRAHRRRRPQQVGRGADQDVRGLERLDPPGEQQHLGVLGHPESGTGGVTSVGGGEHVEVDAGRHHRHPLGQGAVQLDQLAPLGLGARHQPVGRRHDLLLADLAAGGLGRVALGQVGVLHLRHRVHAVHERDVPAVGHEPADLARQPVVGVHDVVPAGVLRRLGPHHAGRERAQLARQVVLPEPGQRPGHHVAHRHPGRELDVGVGEP